MGTLFGFGNSPRLGGRVVLYNIVNLWSPFAIGASEPYHVIDSTSGKSKYFIYQDSKYEQTAAVLLRCLTDQGRLLIHIPFEPLRSLPPSTLSPCNHPVTQSCKNSVTLTDLYRDFRVNLATCYTVKSTCDARRTFTAMI